MDAKAMVNAMLVQYFQGSTSKYNGEREDARYWAGMYDMLTHAVGLAYDLNPTEADTWVAEELQERQIAMCD